MLFMDFKLYLLGLPLVASLIGYSTNWIAIRMLFRPLEEKRLFGWRIPFTPGLIPRRKSEIAENIGEAVGGHLLTPKALEARLGSPEVKLELEEAVKDLMAGFLTRERGSIEDMIPPEAKQDLEALTDHLVGRLEDGLERIIVGSHLEGLVRDLIEAGVQDLSEKKVGEIVSRLSYEEITISLEKVLSGLADSPELENNIQDFWQEKLIELREGGGSLRDYLGEDLSSTITRQVGENLPFLLKKGAEILDRPELRTRLEELILELLDEQIRGKFEEDSVWDQVKLGFLETLVLPEDKLKAKVKEIIDDGVPKLIELLEREAVREEVTSSAIRSVEKLLRKDLSDLGWSDRGVERLSGILTDLTVTLVENERVQSVILEGLVIILKNSEDRKVKELVELEGEDEKEALVRAISGYVIDSLKSKRVQASIVTTIEDKLRDLRGKELGQLSRWIDPDLVKPFAGPIVDRLTVVAAREGSSVLSAVNVKEVVKGEVEEFSTLRVERLILDVTGNQFRAITWFGALIGFLIGILQILVITLGG